MKRKAMTLIELIVYMALSQVALMVIWSLYSVATQSQKGSYSSYLVGGVTEEAIVNLRQDLEQTALASVRAYPNAGNTTEPPGISFVSALNESQMQVNAYGYPRWQKQVYYTLTGKPGDPTGTLMRWEQPIDPAAVDFLPQTAPLAPSSQSVPGRGFLVHTLLPNVEPKGLANITTADSFGGFRVQFVTYDGHDWGVTSTNPAQNSGATATAANNTRLLEVEVKILQTGMTEKPDFYALKFRVRPRY